MMIRFSLIISYNYNHLNTKEFQENQWINHYQVLFHWHMNTFNVPDIRVTPSQGEQNRLAGNQPEKSLGITTLPWESLPKDSTPIQGASNLLLQRVSRWTTGLHCDTRACGHYNTTSYWPCGCVDAGGPARDPWREKDSDCHSLIAVNHRESALWWFIKGSHGNYHQRVEVSNLRQTIQYQ